MDPYSHSTDIPLSVIAATTPYLEPEPVTLPDGRRATIYPFFRAQESESIEVCAEEKRVTVEEERFDVLGKVLWRMFNREIEEGKTYPQINTLEYEEFKGYWFASFTAVMLLDTDTPQDNLTTDIESRCLGTFYVKPNYIGRCGHVCNAGFLVSDKARGQGVGKTLGKQYVQWAPKLGYKSSIFNLVFETNVASQRIWDRLGFEKVGRVKKAAFVKGYSEERGLVDAFIYYYEFTE
ncbi:hypothetical protein BZA70DRAFT_242817 [Myxozyma melibiosi]|uniref:N-acetyltransferase domain-containing protein n=1 Tax=Myxozyma melibiosi TaxID=54550 RepID=A0ABR1EXZ2_9ASCO